MFKNKPSLIPTEFVRAVVLDANSVPDKAFLRPMLWTTGHKSALQATQRCPPLSLRHFSAVASSGGQDENKLDAARWKTKDWESKFLTVLQTYKELTGGTNFVAPSDDARWPK
ncbi:hypothetical protein PHYPSEUDO_008833 [Phytophthora pseudosyringae]|uniref:Uncharacterized protein n=1 Tax=Phytophthora pseudosyringae TaxID=221518 RepID=A0A8T1VIM9_9STRA|nr:hypothetical protein PHYPSEUDO_008833 [Phytophthora pseudosyringae]